MIWMRLRILAFASACDALGAAESELELAPGARVGIADGTPVREIVGDDPAEFAETFAQAYSGKRWIDKERERLNKAIDDAEQEEKQ